MGFIDDDDLAGLSNAAALTQGTPIPLQMVSSDEYMPSPQSARQAEVGKRLGQMVEDIGGSLGLSRRRFFRSASGMAAAFVAMNQTYGSELFAATLDEARSPDTANARAHALKDQFVIDVHTHFVHDHFLPEAAQKLPFPWRKAVKEFGWNPDITDISMKGVQFANYHKEIYFDSDTKIALISSAPGAATPFMPLNNQQMADARAHVNAEAGSRRMLSHAVFAPGAPGWEEDLDAALLLNPDSLKGYTIGSTGLDTKGRVTKLWPWRMDGEDAYKAYDKMVKSGITTVCVHKGLFPPSLERKFPGLRGFVDVSDVGQAAKDWPGLNFVIYHAGYRHTDEAADARHDPEVALAEFERTGRISWVSDLAEIPAQYGVSNVYADLGQVFGMTMIAQPRICAAMLGVLIKGLGADKVCWGTDAVWSGSPQWQIEGLRRIEIPEDMRRRHGFARLGSATGKVKSGIFADNSARLYGLGSDVRSAVMGDKLALAKARYELAGSEPSNRQYGFIAQKV